MSDVTRSRRIARLAAPLIGLALVAVLAVPAIYWAERSSLAEWARKTERFRPKQRLVQKNFHSEGVTTPATLPAPEAQLADDEPVVGVEAAGAYRAYRLRSMAALTRHVINDLVGGKAVTVTFCDLNDCVRAFGGGESKTPLDVTVAGLADGSMLIGVGDHIYFQNTSEIANPETDKAAPRFPYPSIPATRTTWGEWKSLHPTTDVYIHPSAPASGETAEPKSPATVSHPGNAPTSDASTTPAP